MEIEIKLTRSDLVRKHNIPAGGLNLWEDFGLDAVLISKATRIEFHEDGVVRRVFKQKRRRKCRDIY